MNDDGDSYVLDSYAFLAYLGGETGAAKVEQLLKQAQEGACVLYLSWINLGEALYIVERQRGLHEALSVIGLLQQLPVKLLEVTKEQVLDAAHIKANYPLAYADAFAVAAAQDKGSKLVTGDPEFEAVSELVEILWISK